MSTSGPSEANVSPRSETLPMALCASFLRLCRHVPLTRIPTYSGAAINLVVCVESARTLISHTEEDGETNQIFVPALIAVASALGVKIILFFYCLAYRKHSTQVEMLYQDHRNDLWINTFGGYTPASYFIQTSTNYRYPHVCWWK